MSSFLVRTATRPGHTTRLSQNRNHEIPRNPRPKSRNYFRTSASLYLESCRKARQTQRYNDIRRCVGSAVLLTVITLIFMGMRHDDSATEVVRRRLPKKGSAVSALVQHFENLGNPPPPPPQRRRQSVRSQSATSSPDKLPQVPVRNTKTAGDSSSPSLEETTGVDLITTKSDSKSTEPKTVASELPTKYCQNPDCGDAIPPGKSCEKCNRATARSGNYKAKAPCYNADWDYWDDFDDR